MKLYNVKLF